MSLHCYECDSENLGMTAENVDSRFYCFNCGERGLCSALTTKKQLDSYAGFQVGDRVIVDGVFRVSNGQENRLLPNNGVIVRVTPDSSFPYGVRLADKTLAFAENEIELVGDTDDAVDRDAELCWALEYCQ